MKMSKIITISDIMQHTEESLYQVLIEGYDVEVYEEIWNTREGMKIPISKIYADGVDEFVIYISEKSFLNLLKEKENENDS
jgi:hypothetical protein